MMKTWVRYALISAISVAVIGGSTFGAQRWAYSKGIKEVKEGGANNLEKGFDNLRLARNLGDLDAEKGLAAEQCTLGLIYWQGQGVSQDYKKAAILFQKAADQGSAVAQNMLGVCYGNGQGVPQNYVKAFLLFQQAAEQGNIDAQFNLGLSYQSGQNFSKDLGNAVKWYRKAAEQGHPRAQTALTDPEILKYEQEELIKAANQQAKHEKDERENGELIDYRTFYAKTYSTGLPIGKRFRFRANTYHSLNLDDPDQRGAGNIIRGEAAFDDVTQYEKFLLGTDSMTHEIVASMGSGGRILIHQIH